MTNVQSQSAGHLHGKEIDSARRATWRWPSVTVSVPEKSLVEFCGVRKPRYGDLALCQVETVGANTFIENSVGCNMSIFPGTVLLGAFAPRYAMDEFEGAIPESIYSGQRVALLNRGGTIGEVVSMNSHYKDPTMLKVLSFLKDSEGRVANLKNFGKPGSTIPTTSRKTGRKLIVVVGTAMNSGKSSTAKAITYALTASGEQVVAAKATGQGCRRDVLLMKAAGASHTVDFMDFGYPSTYLLPKEEVSDLFWKIYNDLHEKAGPDGYMVIEFADGIYQRETSMLLSDPLIKKQISSLVFSCCDSLSAVAGVEALRTRFGLETTAISGPCANSDLGLREVTQFLGDFPAFNNMVMDVPHIVQILGDRMSHKRVAIESSVPVRRIDIEPEVSLQPDITPEINAQPMLANSER